MQKRRLRTLTPRHVLIFTVLFWIVLGLCASMAHAQGGGFVWSERSSSQPHGRYVVMWNATGSEIADGVLVQVDTTGTTVQPQIPLGKGFKTWTANPDDFYKIVGVTMGNVPGYSQGRIMVEGFHNHVLMDSTGTAGFSRVRPSLKTAGALHVYTANPDSLNAAKKACGIFERYVSTSVLYGYVYVRMNWLGR